MAYYSNKQLKKFGFKYIGKNVNISTSTNIYSCNKIEIGNNSRIDDFCILSGKIKIGKNVHIAPHCLVSGGSKGIIFEDFTTIAYGVKVFTQSDDYSGKTMTNATISKKYKNEFKKKVILKKYTIVGAGSIIMPNVTLEKGTAVGAMSLLLGNTKKWIIYAGIPAKRIKKRKKDLLKLKKQYLLENF